MEPSGLSEHQDSTETPNRATVALVAEMVRGLRDLSTSEFQNIKERIEPLAGLPVTVVKLEAEIAALKHRVTDLETGETEADNRNFTLKRIHLPGLLVSVLFLLVALADLIFQLATAH